MNEVKIPARAPGNPEGQIVPLLSASLPGGAQAAKAFKSQLALHETKLPKLTGQGEPVQAGKLAPVPMVRLTDHEGIAIARSARRVPSLMVKTDDDAMAPIRPFETFDDKTENFPEPQTAGVEVVEMGAPDAAEEAPETAEEDLGRVDAKDSPMAGVAAAMMTIFTSPVVDAKAVALHGGATRYFWQEIEVDHLLAAICATPEGDQQGDVSIRFDSGIALAEGAILSEREDGSLMLRLVGVHSGLGAGEMSQLASQIIARTADKRLKIRKVDFDSVRWEDEDVELSEPGGHIDRLDRKITV